MRIVYCLMWIGCSGSPPRPEAELPVAPVCPARFAAATGHCVGAASCDYPEGNCACTACSRGGAARRPDTPSPERFWICAPTPPAVRPDGCPGLPPAADATCADVDKQCLYSDRCGYETIAVCANGAWLVTLPSPDP